MSIDSRPLAVATSAEVSNEVIQWKLSAENA